MHWNFRRCLSTVWIVGVCAWLGGCGGEGLLPQLTKSARLTGESEVALELRLALERTTGPVKVRFFGRPVTAAGPDFRLVVLPDTQYYSQNFTHIFRTQAGYIAAQRDALNIAAVLHLGDIVNRPTPLQMGFADEAVRVLESVPDLPFGLCVGNHDQSPNGHPAGTAAFNTWFGVERFATQSWYGGHFGDDNDNHFILFSSGGLEFIALFLEYDPTVNLDVVDWADAVLAAHPNHRAIVCTHHLLDPPVFGGDFSPQGRALYTRLREHENLFLMLGGHMCEANRRTLNHDGRIVHAVLSDYQCRPNGGDGWLRLLHFSPARNTIFVTTYSPTRDAWLVVSEHRFALPYDMGGDETPFAELGQIVLRPGQEGAVIWTGLEPGRAYEWYATADTGTTTAVGMLQQTVVKQGVHTLPVRLPVAP